jgi:hypothetical protein
VEHVSWAMKQAARETMVLPYSPRIDSFLKRPIEEVPYLLCRYKLLQGQNRVEIFD